MTEAAHSPLGPSSAKRWINCPGSVRATVDMVDVPTKYSIQGTAAHAVAQTCNAEKVAASTMIGKIVLVKSETEEFQVECDQEMVDSVQAFLDHVQQLPGLDFSETRVHLDQWVPKAFGTLDRARATDEVVYIRDFKHGEGVQVYVKDDEQTRLYAAGFLHDFGWLYPGLRRFNLGIVQPRLDHYDEVEITVEDLLKWMDEIVVPAYKRTQQRAAPFKAGEWCRFCKIRPTCMVLAGSIFKEVVGEFDTLDAAITHATIVGALPAVNMSNEQVGRALHMLPQVKAWCAAVEGYAMREIQRGHRIGDELTPWKLVEGRSNRVFKDPDKAAQILHGEGVDPYERKLISPAKAEAALGKKRFAVVEDLVYKPPGKPKLAPSSDKRPPLIEHVEFEPLDDE